MKHLIAFAFVLVSLTMSAQTAHTVMSSHNKPGVSALSVNSMNNPWVGGKLVYKTKGDLSNAFILSARVIHVPVSGENFAFPIVGNVALNDLDSISIDNGVSIGVFPWYKVYQKEELTIVLHGGLNYQVPEVADISKANTIRFLAGVEIAIAAKDGGAPFTLSAAPSAVWRTGDDPADTFGLELTGVLPIANGLGVLIEGTVPFSKNTFVDQALKIGVIVNGVID